MERSIKYRKDVDWAVSQTEYPMVLPLLFTGSNFESGAFRIEGGGWKIRPTIYRNDAGKFSVSIPAITFENPEGASAKLYRWLEQQPEPTVKPDAFFLKALEFSNGRVFDALLAGWNTLVLGSKSGGRERNYLRKTKSLADIRGDAGLLETLHDLSIPKENYKWTSVADNFSAWYHFWGTMLYAYYNEAAVLGKVANGQTITEFMIFLEEKTAFKLFVPADCGKRYEIDQEGAIAGYRLARLFRGDLAQSPSTAAAPYLYPRAGR